MRVLLVVFALCIGVIITLANSGLLAAHVGWLYRWPGGDKLAHFLLIGSLAGLADLACGGRASRVFGRSLPRGSVWVTVLVVLEEASQAWLPTRSCSLTDLAADLAGILIVGGWLRSLPGKRKTPVAVSPCGPAPS